MEEICRGADIVVAAAGKAKMLTSAFFSEKSVVIDVGINVDEKGNLCGDVDYEAVAPIVAAISPVPGGVGAVTTSVLAQHVLKAAGLQV
jgi:methylenetetrahydrofolate dehydrogenase (NADP+)/methenyltetrahydrofolate cyclohydrolase